MEDQQKAVSISWKDLVTRTLLIVLGFTITTMLHVLTMAKGWGLEPKSWFWIIGAGVFGLSFVRLWVEKVLEGK